MELPTFLMITLQKVFSLQIPESNNIDPQSESMSCPTSKSIMKCRRQPSITAIQDVYKESSFSFSAVEKIDV